MMSKFKWIIIFTVIFSLTVYSGVNAENKKEKDRAQISQPEQKAIRHIIFITVDGLSDQRIKSVYTPNINGLAASGVRTAAIGVLPANSVAFTASLLTGADPSVHGCVAAGQQSKTRLLPDIICGYGRNSIYVSYPGYIPKGFFNRQGECEVKTYEVNSGGNKGLVSKAIDLFKQKHPFFLGLNLPGLQSALTQPGNSAKIQKAVNEIDTQIGRLLAALRASGIYSESLIVLAGNYSDVSGEGGKQLLDNDLMVPVIMAGPGLKSGTVLPPVKITDIAPTAALLAGLQISPESSGKVLWNALRSGTGFLEENLLLKRVKDLSEENVRTIRMVYHMTEEKRLVKFEKEKINMEKAEIHTTINNKDRQINLLKNKIKLLKLLEIITIAALAAGYAVEYFYLRKKFLMF